MRGRNGRLENVDSRWSAGVLRTDDWTRWQLPIVRRNRRLGESWQSNLFIMSLEKRDIHWPNKGCEIVRFFLFSRTGRRPQVSSIKKGHIHLNWSKLTLEVLWSLLRSGAERFIPLSHSLACKRKVTKNAKLVVNTSNLSHISHPGSLNT